MSTYPWLVFRQVHKCCNDTPKAAKAHLHRNPNARLHTSTDIIAGPCSNQGKDRVSSRQDELLVSDPFGMTGVLASCCQESICILNMWFSTANQHDTSDDCEDLNSEKKYSTLTSFVGCIVNTKCAEAS
jgi:hypothetical protein